jgi:hypothetical protein
MISFPFRSLVSDINAEIDGNGWASLVPGGHAPGSDRAEAPFLKQPEWTGKRGKKLKSNVAWAESCFASSHGACAFLAREV